MVEPKDLVAQTLIKDQHVDIATFWRLNQRLLHGQEVENQTSWTPDKASAEKH